MEILFGLLLIGLYLTMVIFPIMLDSGKEFINPEKILRCRLCLAVAGAVISVALFALGYPAKFWYWSALLTALPPVSIARFFVLYHRRHGILRKELRLWRQGLARAIVEISSRPPKPAGPPLPHRPADALSFPVPCLN